jgi:UDP-N-acetyl-2-amino-2-deoxyglucuronate dehydrogenase
MAESSNRVLGVGIRGAGQVAYEHAKAIAANPHLRLAAVASRRRERSEALVRAMTPRDAPEAKVYDRYEDMLEDPGVEIVSICMPNFLHAREAIAAFAAGKHLILEKPPAITWEELADLRKAARTATTRSVVSFVSRWHPMVRNLRAVLDRNAIGDIYYTEVDYWHGIKPTFASYEWIRRREFAGGAMITGGCHAADLARYLKRAEAAEVSAYRCGTRPDFDYPTTLVAAVRFADGTVGKLSASLDGVAFPYQMNIDLLGTEGAIRDNRVYSRVLFPQQNDFVTIATPTINSGAVTHHPFREEIDNLVQAILGGAPVLSDVLDACNSIAISLAIEQSAATEKPVVVPAEGAA